MDYLHCLGIAKNFTDINSLKAQPKGQVGALILNEMVVKPEGRDPVGDLIGSHLRRESDVRFVEKSRGH